MTALALPRPLARQVERFADRFLQPEGMAPIDFAKPVDEPSLTAPDAVAWRVFKSPLALFIGGVTAVLLELAEPRVRSGVWDHTTFRTDPVARMRRTGLAAMVTVYGARSVAERMIASVSAMHARVSGTTPDGAHYRADEPELLNWVQATAAFGFSEAYSVYVRPLPRAARDRFYAEGAPAARLYGATGAPTSSAEMEALFTAMRPKLERSDIVLEFLDIVAAAPILPAGARWMQPTLIKAAVDITPDWAREILGLGPEWSLPAWRRALVGAVCRLADRVKMEGGPAVQACRRLGLPDDYLFTASAGTPS